MQLLIFQNSDQIYAINYFQFSYKNFYFGFSLNAFKFPTIFLVSIYLLVEVSKLFSSFHNIFRILLLYFYRNHNMEHSTMVIVTSYTRLRFTDIQPDPRSS